VAWFKARARVRRARELFAYGQVIASRGEPASSLRSARLYRRGLALLHVPLDVPTHQSDRVNAREQLRAALRRRGLLGWLSARSRQSVAIVSVGVLLLMIGVSVRWLEPDLAEGQRWLASSAYGAFPRMGVMRGDPPLDGRFHTAEEAEPWVRIDLGKLQRVHAVRVQNRTNCCRDRAIPLAIELSRDGNDWTLVGYRRLIFDTFTQQFAPLEARYVRLRVDRRSMLHLLRVSVY
jgi:hypothetical protein